jgi:hypothetical protein
VPGRLRGTGEGTGCRRAARGRRRSAGAVPAGRASGDGASEGISFGAWPRWGWRPPRGSGGSRSRLPTPGGRLTQGGDDNLAPAISSYSSAPQPQGRWAYSHSAAFAGSTAPASAAWWSVAGTASVAATLSTRSPRSAQNRPAGPCCTMRRCWQRSISGTYGKPAAAFMMSPRSPVLRSSFSARRAAVARSLAVSWGHRHERAAS